MGPTDALPELSQHNPARDERCFVTGSDVASWRAADDLVVVDTRSADAFRRAQIPGSINIPAYALRTKSYLRPKRVLLLAEGSGADLEPVCLGLRDAGFATVGILDGGLTFWARNVGGVVGDARAIRLLNRITPAQLAAELPTEQWLVVDVSGGDASANALSGLRLPAVAGDRLRRAVQRAVAQRGDDRSPTFIIVADQRGETYDRIEADLAPLALPHLYFLEGGVESYRNYQAQQRQMAAAPKRGCPTCGGR